MNLKRILVFIMFACLVVCTACSKKTAIETNKAEVELIEDNGATTEEGAQEENAQEENAETTSTEPSLDEKNTEENGATTEEGAQNENAETTSEEQSLEEEETTGEELPLTGQELESQESMEAYGKFLKNETKVSFDRYMPKNYSGEALYKKGSEYTLSEVLDIVIAYYFTYSTNKKIEFIDYSYIDCGKDGVNELVLRLNGMDIYEMDDDSTLVYIIKYIDGKLSNCYFYETWARSESTMNEYGYYQSGGSNGASNHMIEYSLIDKDGNWQFIVSIESELDINQLAWSDELGQIPEVAETKGISSGIELDTICFDNNENVANSDEAGNKECFYTFYAYDDNWEPIEDANLYTNSIYKEIFDEALVPFITPDEVSTMISEKEEKVGATAEIKEGKEMTWKALSGNMFSDYVGR